MWIWKMIASHTLLGMWLLIHAGNKLNHASKRGPRSHHISGVLQRYAHGKIEVRLSLINLFALRKMLLVSISVAGCDMIGTEAVKATSKEKESTRILCKLRIIWDVKIGHIKHKMLICYELLRYMYIYICINWITNNAEHVFRYAVLTD